MDGNSLSLLKKSAASGPKHPGIQGKERIKFVQMEWTYQPFRIHFKGNPDSAVS